MTKGMLVSVYRAAEFSDATNNGITARHNRLLLIDPAAGDSFRVFDAKDGDEVLVVDHRGGMDHAYLKPVARPARIENGQIVPTKKWTMFGGNFVSTSDSRFRERFGHVLPVHDRIE
ncbi:MAG: hypothetical protein EBS90_07980 [Betaproteobacteria bacterium]|nr:hypothetical protein [Betaproteobacteria bacterium]